MARRRECGRAKRNKRADYHLFALSAVGWWHSHGLSQTACKAAIMQKLLAVALFGFACAAPTLAAAAAPANTEILQQRTADGRLLLTDRPAAGAKTERSWQIEREDPAAARQRAIDVKAEANLVAERVQRSIERQRMADDETQRMRLARLDVDQRSAAYDSDDAVGGSVILFAPHRLRLPHRMHSPRFGPPHGRGGRGMGRTGA
jgi:hypothetical protein